MRSLALVMAVTALVPASAPAARASRRTTIGPGTVLLRVRQPGPGGPIHAYVLRVDLTDRSVRAGILYPGAIAGVRTVSAMASGAGAFAAVNGDYFNIGATGAPVGPVVSRGALIKAPQPGRGLAAGVGMDGVGRIATLRLEGFAALPAGRVPLADVNDANPGYPPMIAPNGVGLFTAAWGTYSRAGAVRGQRVVTEVLIRAGRVARVTHHAGAGRIPAGSYVLLGAGSGARALARLRIGQPVTVHDRQSSSARSPFRFALGGKYRLLAGGVVRGGLPVSSGAPRTAIGFSNHGRTMYLVATEGPQGGVPGLDLPQLAGFMRGLGVVDAINLDDGGSTTIVARLPGHRGLTLLNHPADGSERQVANGIGLFAVTGSAG